MAFEPLKPMDYSKALQRVSEMHPYVLIQEAAVRSRFTKVTVMTIR